MAGNPSLQNLFFEKKYKKQQLLIRKDNFQTADYETCEGLSYIEPYDPRCRSWYIQSLEHLGYNFYKPYVDATNSKVIMTLSSQARDQKGKFLSILNIDFGIDNLINTVFAQQDQNGTEAFDQYNVLLHEDQTTVFYHKEYDNNSGVLKSWEDIEFGEKFNFTADEKINFSQQVNQSIAFMKQGNYSIQGYQNVEPLFQYWKRNGEKLQIAIFLVPFSSHFFQYKIYISISLIYPIKMNNNLSVLTQQERKTYYYSILIVAKVSKDYRDQLQLFKVLDNNSLIIPFMVESILLTLFIIFFLLHYGILQFRQVYIPLILLIQFLKKTLNQQLLSACYQRTNKLTSSNDQASPKDRNNMNNQIKFTTSYFKNNARNLNQCTETTIKIKKNNIFSMDSPIKKRQQKPSFFPMRNFTFSQQNKDLMNMTEKIEGNQNLNSNAYETFKFNQTQILTTNNEEETFKIFKLQNSQVRKNIIQSVFENTNLEEQKRRESSPVPSPSHDVSNRTAQEIQEINMFSNNIQQEIHLRSERRKITNIVATNNSEFRVSSQKELQPINLKRSSLNEKKPSQYNKIYEQKESPSNRNSPFRDTKSDTYSFFRRKEQSAQYTQNSGEKQEDKEQNIGQIDPMFKEMSIIKDTFEQLEQVINYAISSSHSHQSFIQNLLHFANAKSTFQKISNISGLNRCYFNLGVLNILTENYEQSIEQLNASILTSLQGNCIQSLDDFAVCLEKGLINYTDDQLFIFSKKLFALSYAHKQILLSTLIDQNLFKQIKTNDEQSLAFKSLKYLELIAKIIWLRPNLFKIVFRLIIIIQFVEFNLLMGNLQIADSYLDEFNQIIHNQSSTQQFIIIKQIQNRYLSQKNNQTLIREKRATLEQIYLNLQLQNEDSETLITQITIKYIYLKAQIYYKQQNYKDAAENYTQCIEEGKTYDIQIRNYSLIYLKKIFEQQQLYSFELESMLDQTNQMNLFCDIVIIFDLSQANILNIKNQIQQIKNLIEMEYFKKEDRIMILSYGEQLNVVQYFEQIKNPRQWDIIFQEILQKKDSYFELGYDEQKTNKIFKFFEVNSKITLSEALIFGLIHSQEFNKVTLNEQNQSINRRKQIISFSLQNQNSLISFYDQIFSQQQKDFIDNYIKIKPDIYHLNYPDYQNIDSQIEDHFDSSVPHLVSQNYLNLYHYQTENQFIQSLFKQRNSQKNSQHSLFLSFISNQD